MTLTSTVTLTAEGTTGFNPDGWTAVVGAAVQLPGLDPGFTHMLRAVEISADRMAATVTIVTYTEPGLDLARNLSILPGPKALIRAVNRAGQTLAEGAFDAPLMAGQPVWINGAPHLVTGVEYPHRDPNSGTAGHDPDWQVATVDPVPAEKITILPDPVGGGR